MDSGNVSMAFEKEAKPFIFNNYRISLMLNSIQFSIHCLRAHCELAPVVDAGNSGMNQTRLSL